MGVRIKGRMYFFPNNALDELPDSSQQWGQLGRSDQETFEDKHVKQIFPLICW